MLMRLTRELQKKVRVNDLVESPGMDAPFLDWTCRTMRAGRKQYILVSNTASLYSCVFPGGAIRSSKILVERAVEAIRDVTERDGKEDIFDELIAPGRTAARFARTFSRSVTGSMNELEASAAIFLEEGIDCFQVSRRLNQFLLSALSQGPSTRYGTPDDTFFRMASETNERHRARWTHE